MSFDATGGQAPQKLLALAIVGVAALVLGYLLVDSPVMAFLSVFAVIWLVTLPYHPQISIYISVAFVVSAVIVPFAPGRPFAWEMGAVLGWSGLLLTLVLRRERSGMGAIIRQNPFLFIGLIGYCVVLWITMQHRGFGLAILGSGQVGGRFYLQQFLTAVYPFLFAAIAITEKSMVRLFYWQCILALTFLVSDYALSSFGGGASLLLYFFELSTDALNFERQAEGFGIRRYQSLGWVCTGGMMFLWARFGLRRFFSAQAIFLLPLSFLLLGAGVLSGHRYLLIILIMAGVVCAYAQRMLTPRSGLVLALVLILGLPVAYALANSLPLAAQRSISFLPGIEVSAAARQDAEGTWILRRNLVKAGVEMAPEYFWVGRGLGFAATGGDYFARRGDMLTTHIYMGRFYNGVVGLMVNTGVFGTLFMLMFILGGTLAAFRVIMRVRRERWDDPFALVATVVASFWMARALGWMFLHGDSEWALRNFSLPAAMLIAFDFMLKRRFALSSEAARTQPVQVQP